MAASILRTSLDEVPDEKLRDIIDGILEHLQLVPVACHKPIGSIQWYGVALKKDYEQ